jgi:ubiquinone/menaquinone biosynthesis C-methylase UbiE/DNA-binding MarR family transcriptional regulator
MALERCTVKLDACSELLKLLGDRSRLRLLMILQKTELTVAELAQITNLKQPRVSTHLSKLKEANLVSDRRAGVQAFYRCNLPASESEQRLLSTILQSTQDRLLAGDETRMKQVLLAREGGQNWADTVAGDMERTYSPGRTWEAVARTAVALMDLGDVLDVASGDGALAELLAPRARSITCVDASEKVIQAARKRLRRHAHVRVVESDMHALSFAEQSFDQALLLQALPYTDKPQALFAEVIRVLKPGGMMLGSALGTHQFAQEVAPFNHKNLGFGAEELRKLLQASGLTDVHVELATRERKAPHFEVLVFTGKRPA